MSNWQSAMLAASLSVGCGGAVDSNEPAEQRDSLSCSEQPRWLATGSYAARRGYLGFAPDGSRLAWASGAYDATLREFDSASGRELSLIDAGSSELPRAELVDRDSSWQR